MIMCPVFECGDETSSSISLLHLFSLPSLLYKDRFLCCHPLCSSMLLFLLLLVIECSFSFFFGCKIFFVSLNKITQQFLNCWAFGCIYTGSTIYLRFGSRGKRETYTQGKKKRERKALLLIFFSFSHDMHVSCLSKPQN